MDAFLKFIDSFKYIIAMLAIIGIEIAPIKISPITWVCRMLDKVLHKSIHETLDDITKQISRLEKDMDFKDIMEIKNKLCNYRVLLQSNGLDEDQYRRCYELVNKYKYYQDKYPGEVNGHMDAVIAYIDESYKKGLINDETSSVD